MIGATPAGQSAADNLITLLNNPDEVKKQIKELNAAKKKADEAIAKHAKVKDIDRLHAEAQANRDKAQIELVEAHAETARLVRVANERAKTIINEAGTNAEKLKAEKLAFENQANQRAHDLDRREQAIGEKESALRAEQTALSDERKGLAMERAEIKRKTDLLQQIL